MGAGYRLAQGVTIAVRYSCVRHQGFKQSQDPEAAARFGRFQPERPILDYQVQQLRVFRQLATAYGMVFAGKYMQQRFQQLQADLEAGDASELPEMHAVSAGLKALCTFKWVRSDDICGPPVESSCY